MSTVGSESDGPQRWARPFVAVLLAGFLVCGIFGIEAWPFSGFRLFSAPRSSLSTGWRLVAISPTGAEEPVNVSRLGAGYRGFGFLARGFRDLAPAERNALCGAWLRATASLGIDAAGLVLVKVEQRLMPRDENGPLAEPHRTSVAACSMEAAA